MALNQTPKELPAASTPSGAHEPGVILGGRSAAEAALGDVDPARYARSRNFLDGAVTQLSPYLRHGVLTLAEVRDRALAVVNKIEDAEKLVNELAWRDYWQRLYQALEDGVWKDLESYKTGYSVSSYQAEMPEAILSGSTGLACMDSFSLQLQRTGYLHNHARMWMAAYLVHWLRVRWQAGARWFLTHLLDGDPASNNLSWQWVASTFSHKPYFFNRENLERYTHGVYCRECPMQEKCPFDGSYYDIEQKLFPNGTSSADGPGSARLNASLRGDGKPSPQSPALARPLLWIHTDSLNPKQKLLVSYPDAPACFVWDEGWLREESISPKRVKFLEECLAEFPASLERRRGKISTQVLASASAGKADHVLAQSTPDPRLRAAARQIERFLPLFWIDPPPFASDRNDYDLKRFSRYWQKARSSALKPTCVG